jgi:hypothetical protein
MRQRWHVPTALPGRYLSAARRRQAVRRVPCPAVNGCLSILGLGLSPRFALPCHARKCSTRAFRIEGCVLVRLRSVVSTVVCPGKETKLLSCIAPQFLRPYPMHYLQGFKLTAGSSYTWQSILAGLNTFKRGFIWRVDIWKKISIWTDPSIPSSSDMKVTSRSLISIWKKISIH